MRISPNPSPEVAAAIAAVIAHIEMEEEAARSRPPVAPRQSAWVESWRPREVQVPLPSHVYDAQPWAFEEPVEERPVQGT